jgi:hypothetical protein
LVFYPEADWALPRRIAAMNVTTRSPSRLTRTLAWTLLLAAGIAACSDSTGREPQDGVFTFQRVAGPFAGHPLMDAWTDGGQTIVVVGGGGTIARTADGGTAWYRPLIGTSGTFNAIWGEGSVLVAVGHFGLVQRSVDGGSVNWMGGSPISTQRGIAKVLKVASPTRRDATRLLFNG